MRGKDIFRASDDARLFISNITELRCQDDPVTPTGDCLAKDFFAVSAPIVRGGIEEGNPGIQRAMDGAHRFGIVDLAPAGRFSVIGPCTANCPTTQAQRTDFKIAASQTSLEHSASNFCEMALRLTKCVVPLHCTTLVFRKKVSLSTS
jgi:hypothetical protein